MRECLCCLPFAVGRPVSFWNEPVTDFQRGIEECEDLARRNEDVDVAGVSPGWFAIVTTG